MQIDVNKFDTVTEVANLVGVPRTTLIYALERGEIEYVQLSRSLTCLVDIAAAQAWAARDRKPGPKPKPPA